MGPLSIEISPSLILCVRRRTACFAKYLVVIQWLQLDILHSVVRVRVEPDDRLQSVRIYTSDLAYHSHLDVLRLVLWNRHVRRRMVLLIAHQDMRDKGTFTGQERYSKLYSFAVPILAILPIELYPINGDVQLMQEPELSPHAEVGHCKEAELLQHELSRKLDLDSRRRHEILERKWCNLHDIADVQRVDPLVLVEVPEDILHVCLADV